MAENANQQPVAHSAGTVPHLSGPAADQKPTGPFSRRHVWLAVTGSAVFIVAYLAFLTPAQSGKKSGSARDSGQQQAVERAAVTAGQSGPDRDYAARLTEAMSQEAIRADAVSRKFGQAAAASARQNEPSPSVPLDVDEDTSDPQTRVKDAISADMQKREANALFASPIVISNRIATPAPVEKQVASAPPTSTPVSDSAVQAAPNRGAPTSKTATQPASNSTSGALHKLFEGTHIDAVLTIRLNGTYTGPVHCMVTTDVWSHNRQHLLIPRGTRVMGEARKVEALGQSRLAVTFHRLIMPDGFSVSLNKFVGLNQIGETGLKDKVDNHYRQIFGVSIALGAIAGFTARGSTVNSNQSGLDSWRQGFSQNLSQEATQILDRYLNILPTVVIREGTRVKICITDDLMLPAYEAHQMSSDL